MPIPVMSDILNVELARMRDACQRSALDLLETGCIRNTAPGHRLADGWSTLIFAEHVKAHSGSTTSVDLDTAQAKAVLASECLAAQVQFIEGHSVEILGALREQGKTYDIVLLDSANDPELTFKEYQIAADMVRRPNLVVVDDVKYYSDSHGVKGDVLLPYLQSKGIEFRVRRRWGGSGWIDVILFESPT